MAEARRMTPGTFLRGFAAVFLVANAAHAQVYRCPGPDGALAYQGTPCPGGTVIAVPASPDPFDPEVRIARAIAMRRVMLGMTAAEVRRSWGEPDNVNLSVSAGSDRREQWVYRRGGIGREQYLYLEGGVLRSMQSSD